MASDVRPDREVIELELRHMLESGFMPASEPGGAPIEITEQTAQAMLANLDEGRTFTEGVDIEHPGQDGDALEL